MSDYGYRVPDGEADISEMACQLVFYPDIPEYRTALFTALERFAAWTSWERDDDHKGKDAATSWKAANELTWECWRMACLEQLQSDVSAILAYLQSSVPCCGDIITYGDSTTYVTTIIPGDGDDPTVYGETAVDDWDDWKEYLCHNAHLWLDELIAQSNSIETVLDVGGLSVGLVAYALAAVALFVVGGFISGPIVVAITAGLIAGYTANLFSDSANELEDSRDQIVCAIMWGSSLSSAIESAISSNVAWNTFYNFIDYDSALAILYEGGDGTTFLEAETRDDCGCEGVQLGEYRFDNDFATGPWEFLGNMAWEAAGRMRRLGSGWSYIRINPSYICNSLSLPDTQNIRIRRIGFSYQKSLSTSYPRVRIANISTEYNWSDSALTEWVWYDVTINFDSLGLDIELEYDDWIDVGVTDTANFYAYVDDFWIEFDELG